MADGIPKQPDLGFRHESRANGEVVIRRQGREVTILRGQAARAFLAKLANGDDADAQQLMARITGNYKRGNESRPARRGPDRKP